MAVEEAYRRMAEIQSLDVLVADAVVEAAVVHNVVEPPESD